MADFGVIAGLDVIPSVKEIKAQLLNLQKVLNADKSTRIKFIGQIDVTKTRDNIKSQLDTLAKSLSGSKVKIDLGVNTSVQGAITKTASQITNAVNQATNSTDLSQKIFNIKELETQGRMYVGESDRLLTTIKKRFLKQGATDVQFLEFRKANDELQSFIATVDYGAGIVKKFNFEKAQLSTGGKKTYNGFVQTDFKSVSDKTMKDYQKTLNFLNTMDKRISDINSKTLNQTKPLQQGTTFYDNYINKLNSVLAVIEKVRTSNNSLTDEEKRNIGLIVNELKNVAKEQQTLAYPPTKLESKSISDSVKKYSAELQTLEQKWKSQGILVGEFKQKVENLKSSIAHVGEDKNALSAFTTQLSIAKQVASKLQSQLKETRAAENLKTKIAVLTNQLIAFKNANSKAMNSTRLSSNGLTFSAEIDSMLAKLKQCADPTVYNQVANNFKVIKNEVTAMGLKGADFLGSLWANIKKFASWMGMTTVMSRAAMEVRQLFTTVVGLDTALIDLKKTFKGTDSELNQFYYDANKVAKQLGVTTEEVIAQSSAWSRLGFSTAEASSNMAKYSAIFKNISPGMDADMATDGLVSMMKAFKIGLEDTDEVLDGIISKVNEVGNTAALNNQDIVEAMTRSSAAMAVANNTLDETIALNTAAIEITRDAATSSNAVKTASMRLRGRRLLPSYKEIYTPCALTRLITI